MKESLRALHRGPYAVPRKFVIDAVGVSEPTYSNWLNDAQPDLPGLTDLMVIVNVTRNPGPFQAMLSKCGDGYLVQEDPDRAEVGSVAGLRLMNLEADTAVDVELARDLEDGRLEPHEALRLIPKLEARQETGRRTLDLAHRVAKTGISAGGLQ